LAASEARRRADAFLAGLQGLGYRFFTGVPCSLLAELYPALEAAGADYRAATREDLAVGLAAGATLAGGRSAVLMQNSGLGVVPNALLSLTTMYRLPLLLVITWRGYGPDAPEHVEMGARTPALLDALGVPHRLAFSEDALDPDFHARPGPVALLVRPGELG
jgi:phosphonopyruvate decarboxylase